MPLKSKEEKAAYMRNYLPKYRQKLRDDCFKAYGGPWCVCCGETELVFLALDHINGGGNKERKLFKSDGGHGVYSRLKKLGYPPGYQVLCHNCNWAKTRGVCPHASRIRKTA